MNRAPCMGAEGMLDYRPFAFKSKGEAVRFANVSNGNLRLSAERPAWLQRTHRTSFSERTFERAVGQGRRGRLAAH